MSDTEELTGEEIESIVYPLYEAYRLGKYSKSEYLPMWHELDEKPVRTLEATMLIGAVTSLLAARLDRATKENNG